MTDEEFAELLELAAARKFDRNEYLLALIEADRALHLKATIDPGTQAKVLRPSGAADVVSPAEATKALHEKMAKHGAKQERL